MWAINQIAKTSVCIILVDLVYHESANIYNGPFTHSFCCCFYAYFTWRWFDAFYYFHYLLQNIFNQNLVCVSSRAG